MSQKETLPHNLEAFTYPSDLVPHIYVEGQVPVVFETAEISLKEKQDALSANLDLEFDPPEYDPNSMTTITIQPFQTIANGHNAIIISTQYGAIRLDVEERQRS